jgi:hypothetical protein
MDAAYGRISIDVRVSGRSNADIAHAQTVPFGGGASLRQTVLSDADNSH